jgi:broad specificity phosphatase PhoE
LTTEQIREGDADWYLWTDGAPGGESPEHVQARVDRLIAELLEVPGPVALFAHGHVLRSLAARWIEQPIAVGGRLALSAGAVSLLGFEREVRVLWRWNLTP